MNASWFSIPQGSRIEEEARSAIWRSGIPKEEIDACATITHIPLHWSHNIPQGLIDID